MKIISDFRSFTDAKLDLTPHFIFCNPSLFDFGDPDHVSEVFEDKMEEYQIQSLIFTTLSLERFCLVTKEKQKQAYKGQLKKDQDWKHYKGSIGDELESFEQN